MGWAFAIPAPAQKFTKLGIVSTNVKTASNMRSDRRLPTVFSPCPDGSGCVGYTDTKGNARVFRVSRKFQKASGEFVVEGQGLVALQANADGSCVVLTSTEEGPNEERPGWCPGENTLWAVKLDADGKVLWRTRLVGGQGYGPQQMWFVRNSAAVLAHNGKVYGAFYSVGKNFAKQGEAANSHEGDEFKAFDDKGEIDEGLSCSWNCSHSKDQRMIVDGEEFRTLTMGDTFPLGVFYKAHPSRARGVAWPKKERGEELKRTFKKMFMPGDLGGISRMGDGLAGTASVFLRDGQSTAIHEAERLVLFLRFDKSGKLLWKRYLTRKPERAGLVAYVGPFGPLALVAWSMPGRSVSTFCVMREDGRYALPPWKAKHRLGPRAGFARMPNGDLVWVFARSGARKVELKRVLLPKSLRGKVAAAGRRPASESPAKDPAKDPAKTRVAKSPPDPKGKLREIVTHYTSGAIQSRYSVDENNLQFGWMTRFFRSGKKRMRMQYAGGVPWGKREDFHRDGKLKVVTAYVEGKQHGERVEYDGNGRIVSRQSFVHGTAVGK